jgi:hypothetical protein
MAQLRGIQPAAETRGLVFNRKDPRSLAGDFVPILDRNGNPTDKHNFVFAKGKDFTSLPDRHRLKMRIPATSVVNKVGACGLCGIHPTAAQWLWMLNLVCFCAHTTMVFLVAYYSWWSKDLSRYENDPNEVRIYRVSATWDNSTVQGYTYTIIDNELPFNLAWGVLMFFAISAVFHLFALVVGLCEATWLWYWRQLDDCWAWWRWVEYAGSASLMAMLLAIVLGIREQNTLACLFMLMFVTQLFGFMTELYSRPVLTVDRADYGWAVGRRGFIGQPDYADNPNALHLVSQTAWEGDRVLRDEDGNTVAKSKDFVGAQRSSNYIRRMLPHVFGYFPFITWMVILIYHLEFNKRQLYEETGGDLQIPAWINAALYGTFIIFSSFATVQVVFQWLPPGLYWGTEVCYCILSLTAKLFLGVLILVNVLMREGRAEDLLGEGGLESAR